MIHLVWHHSAESAREGRGVARARAHSFQYRVPPSALCSRMGGQGANQVRIAEKKIMKGCHAGAVSHVSESEVDISFLMRPSSASERSIRS